MPVRPSKRNIKTDLDALRPYMGAAGLQSRRIAGTDHAPFIGLLDEDEEIVEPNPEHYIQIAGANGLSVNAEVSRIIVNANVLDTELMYITFQSISWAQFAIFDNFDDESKRKDPDTSTYPARIHDGELDNGREVTPNRSFGFISKTYENITTVYSGTSSGASGGHALGTEGGDELYAEDGTQLYTEEWLGFDYLDDASATWYSGKFANYVLIDSAAAAFDIIDSEVHVGYGRLIVSGGPASGAYSIRSAWPSVSVVFCTYSDSTNGGSGYVKLEVSYDGGTNWQTYLDTGVAVNLLGGAVDIDNTGRDFCFRVAVKNDASGNGAKVEKVLVVTNPSVWG